LLNSSEQETGFHVIPLPSSANDWLTLKDAAERLGIHPTTLRRWADSGKIPHMVTPGGHRRFAIADVDHMSNTRRGLQTNSDLEQLWAEKAISQTRADIPAHHGENWLATNDDSARQELRHMGRKLMGVLMQYIALDEQDVDGAAVLAEAQTIGHHYGILAFTHNMSLTDALQATMFFRDTLVEAAIELPESARIRPQANKRLLRRINKVLNAVQLAIASAYETDSNSNSAPPLLRN
jgi:excisionase family DNA binding protein